MADMEARIHEMERERERFLQAQQRQQALTEALHQASAALSTTLNYNEVLDRIMEEMGRVVAHDAANVMLIDGETARVVRGHGYESFGTKSTLGEITLVVSEAVILQRMRETAEPIAIPDVTKDETWVYSRPEHRWIKSYAAAPIRLRDKVIGFLNVNSRQPDFYEHEDGMRLRAFADHAAVAIENARLYHRAQQELTERKKVEAELRQHRDHLEELVRERTVKLMVANEALRQYTEELEQRNEELDAFSHTVAHDLKNPLNLVIGYAEVLPELYDSMPKVDFERNLRLIYDGALKINNIIEELLLLAGVRKQDVEIRPLSMGEVVSEAHKRLVGMVREYEAVIQLPESWPMAYGYGPWVEEVWANYISNAMKYGGRPPQVTLGATTGNGQVQFWVRDNGMGLSSAEQKRLFVPFERLDQARARGHGLGLSVVQRIIEKLGGEVGVESEVGQGSSFFFTLPIHPL